MNLNPLNHRDNFLRLNRERVLRTRSALQSRQQIFLDLLPLLFHVNHPILPGYVGRNAPCGIDHFIPELQTLQRLRDHIAQSFDYAIVEPKTTQIQSLFLMGSCGTVAQSDASDLDLWLCHDSDLASDELALLQKKAEVIADWVAGLGLELHVFLMNAQQFRRGKTDDLSADAVGSSQHYLLLDEFYRSAVLLAGRYPIWWLVPVAQEQDYEACVEALQSQLEPNTTIDFGGIASIPNGEFIGAGIWQLYKAISSPYKAVLKLMLTEVYARETQACGESFQPLSLEFKQSVQDGQTIPDVLDAYILVYRRLEAYLSVRNESGRLELVRRIFYFKTGLRLSQSSSAMNWRQRLMSGLVTEWHWQAEQLYNLDAHRNWKLRRVRDEHRFLVAELTNSYRFLQEFAEQCGSPALINLEEMTILGRKLFAAFERKRNKVEWLNPGIAPNLSEPQLFFYRLSPATDSGWAVAANARHDFESDAILQEHEHLSGLLCWCHCNGLIGENTQLRLVSRNGDLSEVELRELSAHLREFLPERLIAADPDKHNLFRRAKVPVAMLLYLNLDRGPLGGLSAAIGAGGGQYPVASVEIVTINSWGEVVTLAFRGENSLFDLLRVWQQMQLSARRVKPVESRPELAIQSYHDPSSRLGDRIAQLLNKLEQQLLTEQAVRYVLKVGSEFCVIQLSDVDLPIIHAANYSELVQCLGRGQRTYSPIVLDPQCAPGSALAEIAAHSRARSCDIFCYINGDMADVFFNDELGSLVYSAMPCASQEGLLANLEGFLNDCQQQQKRQGKVRAFLLDVSTDGQWRSEPCDIVAKPNPEIPKVEAIVYLPEHRESGDDLQFDLAVNGNWWRFEEYGERVVDLLRQEMKGEPVEIGKLQIQSSGSAPQSAVYLRYKRYLEEWING